MACKRQVERKSEIIPLFQSGKHVPELRARAGLPGEVVLGRVRIDCGADGRVEEVIAEGEVFVVLDLVLDGVFQLGEGESRAASLRGRRRDLRACRLRWCRRR